MRNNQRVSNRPPPAELDTPPGYSTVPEEPDPANWALGLVPERLSVVNGFHSNVTQNNMESQGDACVVVTCDPATPERNWREFNGGPPGAVHLTSECGSLLLKAEAEHPQPTTWLVGRRSPSLTQRFAEALKLQDVEDALDVIFDAVDSALIDGRFRECDRALASVDVDEWPTDLLGGLLSITAAASHELPARAAFFERTRRVVNARGDDTPGLLDGLE